MKTFGMNQISSVRISVNKRDSWKGAAVQRGLEPGSRGTATVRSRYQGRKRVCASDLLSVWKSAMAI
jgi:hypothetical protein